MVDDIGWNNQSFRHIDMAGVEPGTSDNKDRHVWDKWFSWFRKYVNNNCSTRCFIDSDGFYHYSKRLLSDRRGIPTRQSEWLKKNYEVMISSKLARAYMERMQGHG